MERYDYRQAMIEDVLEAIHDDYTAAELREAMEDRDEFCEKLNDDLWTMDSVTGNGSGSYWFNSHKAAEALMFNLDLLAEAVEEFGGDTDVLKDGTEACDVTIRCYLLGWAIDKALDEIEDELEDEEESEEE